MNFDVDSGANLQRFLNANQITMSLAFSEQVHRDKIVFVRDDGRQTGADGVLARSDLVLAVKSADCLPLMIYNREANTIGAVHVSRHNLVMGIIDRLADLGDGEQINFSETSFFFGPHIRAQNYPLSQKGYQSISESRFKMFINEKNRFDLTAAVSDALEQRGASRDNISDCGIDTFDDRRFFSSRADGGSSSPVSVFATIIYKTK